MGSFEEKASKFFFRNKYRNYNDSSDQNKWSENCFMFSKNLVLKLKAIDFNNFSNKQLIDDILNFCINERTKIVDPKLSIPKEKYSEFRDFAVQDDRYDIGIEDFDSKNLFSIKSFLKDKIEFTPKENFLNQSSKNYFDIRVNFHGGFYKIESKNVTLSDEAIECIRINYPTNIDKESLYNCLGEHLKEILSWNKQKPVDELYNNISRFKWNLTVATLTKKGSSSIADLLEHSFYKLHNFEVYPRKGDFVSRDVKCFLYLTENNYASDYLNQFKSNYIPKPSIEVNSLNI